MRAIIVLTCALLGAASTAAAQDIAITNLLTRDLVGLEGKEVTMFTVDYPPGWSDPVHTHDAQAFVYVLQGEIVMQVRGGKPATLKAGEAFYESPKDVHVVGRNASKTAPARFLVVLVKAKGAPILTPAK